MYLVLANNKIKLKEIFSFGFFLLVVSITPYLKIFLPFTPVPFVMQNFVFLFYAAIYGKKKGAFLAGAYLLEGILGVPVFISAKIGLSVFMCPTTGYIIGYILSSYLVGYLFEKIKRASVFLCFISLLSGAFFINLCGFVFLSLYLGCKGSFLLGFVPFMIFDIFKSFVFSFFISRVRKFY